MVWAAVLPSVVAPLPNVSQMKATSVYQPQPVSFCSYGTFSGCYLLSKGGNLSSIFGSGQVFSILTHPRVDPP